MKHIEFWYWQLHDPVSGAPARSTCRLTEADALRRDPHASRVPESCEVRVLLRHPDDYLPSFALRSLSSSRGAGHNSTAS
ncbi:hypothetical protein [Roseateles oligotrophus]|uniref:Uncharacterized protein n=1 Tax=Roseateles oligotrophus TaxID=1769250 RepID=A0ABT2YCW0_9BURK|nr:hypothetical protein [Roseateles oligotrophus]MCV2367889.1 hypothetical protein [Roseateles oligotrophus]